MKINIQTEDVGKRIDQYLVGQIEDTSRTDIQNQIKDGYIKVNGEKVKPNYKLKEDDEISIEQREPESSEITPENLNLDIIYEDSEVAVVYKPAGMVVHPSAGHNSGTLVNGLMYQLDSLSGINGELRPGIVHRIDKDTSGLLMVAKNDVAHRNLSKQLEDKTVDRKYIALVHGVIPHNKGTVEAPIGRNPKERQDMAVVDNGKEAVTHFNVLERYENYTLVECVLETGRTHQIRVHMSYIGYPIVGDPKYGQKTKLKTTGQLLHAGTIGFIHPTTNEHLVFKSDIPDEFKNILEIVEKEEK